MLTTISWCDDERCTLCTKCHYVNDNQVTNKYMIGDEWMLLEYNVHNKFTKFDTVVYNKPPPQPIDFMMESMGCGGGYDIEDDIGVDEYREEDGYGYGYGCEDDTSIASVEYDNSFDWLFDNNKFMYT